MRKGKEVCIKTRSISASLLADSPQSFTKENYPSLILKRNKVLNNNIGTFICVFECTIANLVTYRQFTNAA